MTRRVHKLIIYLSALFIAIIAAAFSIFGLGKLFSSYSLYVMVMAGSIELAKIIIISIVFRYWKEIQNFLLKTFILICFSFAVLITSMGVYGFLTNAYQESINKYEISSNTTGLYETKRNRFTEQKNELKSELNIVSSDIKDKNNTLNNLRNITTVENNTISQGNINRRAKEIRTEVAELTQRRDELNLKLEIAIDSINNIDKTVLQLKTKDETVNELGPLKYIADLTGKPMATVVNWLVLLLIFVFDPLAISLIIFVNQMKIKPGIGPEKENKKKSENIFNLVKQNKKWIDSVPFIDKIEKRFKKNEPDIKPDLVSEEINPIKVKEYIKEEIKPDVDQSIIQNAEELYIPEQNIIENTETDQFIQEELTELNELDSNKTEEPKNPITLPVYGGLMGKDGSIRCQ